MTYYLSAFKEYYLHVLRNGLDFRGRASRKEYWYFVGAHLFVYLIIAPFFASFLVFLLVSVLIPILNFLGIPTNPIPASYSSSWTYWLENIYLLVTCIPFLALGVRRLHDIGRSGFWLLVEFIPLGVIAISIAAMLKSQPHANTYGEVPSN